MKNLIIVLMTAITLFSTNLLIANNNVNVEPTNTITLADGGSYYLRSFCKEIAPIISRFAHPSSDFSYSTVEVSGDVAYIRIYTENIFGNDDRMTVKVWTNRGGLIGGLRVVSDENLMPAFLATSIVKDAIDELMQETRNNAEMSQLRSIVEGMLDKTYYNWDSDDVCVFVMNAIWVSDGYYESYAGN